MKRHLRNPLNEDKYLCGREIKPEDHWRQYTAETCKHCDKKLERMTPDSHLKGSDVEQIL